MTANTNLWRAGYKTRSGEWQGELVAVWEVHRDPMSDDYTPDEMAAPDLLRQWAAAVRKDHPDELIPIYWWVSSESAGKFEAIPFQYEHLKSDTPAENFLTFYKWPENVATGEPL